MGNIHNTLSAFWSSELVSDNKWIIVLLVVFCVMATEFVDRKSTRLNSSHM